MAADALDEAVAEERHREDEGRYLGFVDAVPLLQIGYLANRESKIAERLHETANYDGHEEDVHVHRSEEAHQELVKERKEVLSTFVIQYSERIK